MDTILNVNFGSLGHHHLFGARQDDRSASRQATMLAAAPTLPSLSGRLTSLNSEWTK
jgi:hypothetical protein